MKVKAPFAGHPAASSAWLPAATLSLPGSPESHCNRDTATSGHVFSFSDRNLKMTSTNTALIPLIQLFSFLIVALCSKTRELLPGGLWHKDRNKESDMLGMQLATPLTEANRASIMEWMCVVIWKEMKTPRRAEMLNSLLLLPRRLTSPLSLSACRLSGLPLGRDLQLYGLSEETRTSLLTLWKQRLQKTEELSVPFTLKWGHSEGPRSGSTHHGLLVFSWNSDSSQECSTGFSSGIWSKTVRVCMCKLLLTFSR